MQGQPAPGQPMMQPVVMMPAQGMSIYPSGHWPDHSVTITSEHCKQTGMTHVDENKGTLAWILCLVLCLVGCWLGCCFIPFGVSVCNDQEHKCCHCHKLVGYRKSM